MKLTQIQLKQIIKEELESFLSEKEQMNESQMAAALAALFAGGVDVITIDGKEFTQETLAQVLDADGDGLLDKEFPQSMLDVMQGDIEAGMVDADNEYESSEFRIGNQHMAAVAAGMADKKSTTNIPTPLSTTGGNIKVQLAQMQTALDTQNTDNAMKMAKTILKHPEFKNLSMAQQKMVKSTAGLANLAR